jgi:hypothetical protein
VNKVKEPEQISWKVVKIIFKLIATENELKFKEKAIIYMI